MTQKTSIKPGVVDADSLPARFPTHRHPSLFWESLGRTVATFGFLEEVLGKAIVSFTATKPHDRSEIDAAYEGWLPQLKRALTDPLSGLINQFERAVRKHPNATIEDLNCLLHDLRKASETRNVLCHGSWRAPDTNGASIPFLVNRSGRVFSTSIDCRFLDQTQRHVAELSCKVINSVTHMGWQFPESAGPGKPIFGNCIEPI